MKILIIGPSWVGDMVMSQSLYKKLKEQHQDAEIHVLAPAWCKPILDRMPEVHSSIEMPLGHGALDIATRYKLGKALRKHNFTHSYILPNSAKSALIPFFAKIPNRIGWKGEMRFGLLTDIRTNRKDFQYMIERYCALSQPKVAMLSSESLGGLSSLPYPELNVSDAQRDEVLTKFKLNLERPIVGLCPGAEFGPAKQWPPEYYAELTNYLIPLGYSVWIFGSKNDELTSSQILNNVDSNLQKEVVNLAGKSSLVEATDLLSCCDTVVSNDSGAMHIAAAVGCSVIGIYGSTSPDYTPPLSDKVAILHTDISCRPCFKRECPYGHLKCLKELAPKRAIEAFNTLHA
ncbi:lipopolysaccharide heptosyltransferase II [Vibrio neonatus]|uniref:lipopolysaccharide heptosyltransferase II n=1 Tax=Vibrio neonatus TaxID=278860 RepID=UPI0021C4336B|nr:lipopolysaccharide heptosyltransferase II [Vibrio neonatus]